VSYQAFEQGLRLLKVLCVEALGKPPIDRYLVEVAGFGLADLVMLACQPAQNLPVNVVVAERGHILFTPEAAQPFGYLYPSCPQGRPQGHYYPGVVSYPSCLEGSGHQADCQWAIRAAGSQYVRGRQFLDLRIVHRKATQETVHR
jgi:hypothetical protein